ncbi:unnamed protein product [Symbiodinium sp. CCMP2592]|nr:unnamed protein product [Symbiodinium sp. CCMP2592]
MMQVWCDRHQVAMQDVTFLLGTVAIKPEDTLCSLSCSLEDEVVVRVVRRDWKLLVKMVTQGSELLVISMHQSIPLRRIMKASAPPTRTTHRASMGLCEAGEAFAFCRHVDGRATALASFDPNRWTTSGSDCRNFRKACS